ncbi:MAG: hypothetical protein AB1414_13000 [bacterium]
MNKKSFILPVLLILLIGCFCMGFWGEWDFYIVNDHPIRIQYLWDTLKINLPIFHKLIYWNPFINCGEPSLYLYPPGFIIFGTAIDLITFHQLPIEIIYKLLLIFAYYLPGITSLLFYKKIGLSRISALLGALAMMLYSNMTIGGDVEGGMIIGFLNMRLAVGLAPLILYFALSWNLKNAIWTGLTLGLCLLTHPWGCLLPILAIILLGTPSKKSIGLLLLIFVLASGISCFWSLPAFSHREFLRRAVIWDFSPDDIFTWIKQLQPFCLLYLISLAGLHKKHLRLGFLPLIILIVIPGSYFFHLELLEPSRLKDNFFFSILLLSAVGIEQLLIWLKWRTIYSIASICLIIILLVPFMNSPTRDSYTYGSITYYENFDKYYQMNNIFHTLKDSPPGRILFTSSSRPMKGVYHTHIFALTPVFIGREIIGGIPTAHTPMANYLYYGGKQNKNTDFAEAFDNKSIFGMNYDEGVDVQRLHKICSRLNITTIVVGKYEDKVRSFFLANPDYFPLRTKIGRFHFFDVANYKYSLLDYNKAVVIKGKMDEIHIRVLEAKQNTTLGVKISYYPLWKASIDNIQLKVSQDEMGLIKVNLPAGKNYIVKLKYEEGLMEQIGWIITILSLVSGFLLLCCQPFFTQVVNNEAG